MLYSIFAPLTLLIIISFFIALVLKSFGIATWIGFIIGIIGQIIIRNMFVTVLDTIVQLKDKKLENERIKEFSYQGLEVACPCTKKHIDFVPIRLNTPNMYKCTGCNKPVSVFINTETAIQTEPITNTDITAAITPIIANNEN